MRLPRYAALMLGAAMTVPVALPAFADVEVGEVESRLKTLFVNQGIGAEWDEITEEDGDFTVSGLKVSLPGETDKLDLGDLDLVGVEELDNGDYQVDEITLPAFKTSAEGLDFAMSDIVINGALLTAADSTDPLAGTLIPEKMTLADMNVSAGGKTLFALTNLAYDIQRSNDGKDMAYTAKADRFSSDLSGVGDPSTIGILTALQLVKIDGNLVTSGNWSLDSGLLSMKQFDIAVDNAGKIGMTMDAGGYTTDFLKAARELNKTMVNATPEQQQAQGVAALGLMQQLTLNGMSFRYDDSSFAMRAMEVFAATQSARAADLPGTAQFLLPPVVAPYVSAEVAQAITAEVVKFLREPKNIEIRIAPAQPIPFAMLGQAAGDPKALIEQLGLTVKSNQ